MPTNNQLPFVAMVANYPKGTGYAWWLMERFWDEISVAAKVRGWQSNVIYPMQHSKAHSINQTKDHLSRLEAFISNGKLREVIDIYLLIRRQNIRSIYLTDRPFRSWKYFLLKLSGVKSIVVHDHTPGDRPAIAGINGIAKYFLNSVPLFTANLIIAISPVMRQRHLLNARIPSSRIVTVINGIVVRDLVSNARELLLAKFNLTPESFIVSAVGRLNPYKRFDFAIKCVDKLAKENSGIKPVLIIVGDGPDRLRLEGIVNSLRPNCKVIFAGQVDDTWPILCGVDAVIHPSAGEGLSLAILEAMAAARPVVVPSLPSVSQTIENGVNGLIYHDGSHDAASRLLHGLSTDDTLRAMLGRNARDKVLEHYQLTRALDDFHKSVIPALFRTQAI